MADHGVRARRRPHVAADPRDPHGGAGPAGDGPLVDPGAPRLAAQRAPLRRPHRPQQGGDGRALRRGPGEGVAPQLRRPAAADRRRTTSTTPTATSATRRSRRATLPLTECLEDVVARLLPYWDEVHRAGPARRAHRARRRPRQQPARARQAPRRHQRRRHRRAEHPHGRAARVRARRRPPAGGDQPVEERYLRSPEEIRAAAEAVARQAEGR